MARLFVRFCGLLIVLRSFTNFAKLFHGDQAVLVFFGQILHGSSVSVPAFVVGLFMLATGISMLRLDRWALPLCAVYAAYVLVNLLAWTVTNPGEFDRVGRMVVNAGEPDEIRRFGRLAFLGYSAVALATTALPAWMLWKQRTASPS